MRKEVRSRGRAGHWMEKKTDISFSVLAEGSKEEATQRCGGGEISNPLSAAIVHPNLYIHCFLNTLPIFKIIFPYNEKLF